MKAIIWIIVLALLGWGIWWFARDNNPEVDVGTNTTEINNSADLGTGGPDEDIDLGEFEDKG